MSNSKTFDDYRVESGVCRPSGAQNNEELGYKAWEKIGSVTIDECHKRCANRGGCRGFDVVRPQNESGNKFLCYLHFNDDMKGDKTSQDCNTRNDCSCYLKEKRSSNPTVG